MDQSRIGEFVAITRMEYDVLQTKLDKIIRLLDRPKQEGKIAYDNADIIQLLNISQRTLSTWREKGVIKYTKVGRKIFYRPEDVRWVLENGAEY